MKLTMFLLFMSIFPSKILAGDIENFTQLSKLRAICYVTGEITKIATEHQMTDFQRRIPNWSETSLTFLNSYWASLTPILKQNGYDFSAAELTAFTENLSKQINNSIKAVDDNSGLTGVKELQIKSCDFADKKQELMSIM